MDTFSSPDPPLQTVSGRSGKWPTVPCLLALLAWVLSGPLAAASTDGEPLAADLTAPLAASAAPTDSYVAPFGGQKSDWYFDVNYVLWWLGDTHLPPLVASNPATTPLDEVGVPGQADYSVVVGDETTGLWPQSGIEFRLGGLLVEPNIAFEVSGFVLFEGGKTWSDFSDGDPILTRPFTDATTGQPDAQLLAFPGLVGGGLETRYERQLWAVDPTVRWCLRCGEYRHFEALTGYRYLHLGDDLTLSEQATLAGGGLIVPGTRYDIEDRFRARNDLHLWTLGLAAAGHREHLSWDVRGLVGLGFVYQQVDIDGRTRIAVPGASPDLLSGGLLALSSNMGQHDRSRFAWLPEVRATVGYWLTSRLQLRAGYTVMYLNDVVRAPEQIDMAIDPGLLPPPITAGAERPQMTFHSDDAWIHGLHAGLRWEF
jgi:hypothetical protein